MADKLSMMQASLSYITEKFGAVLKGYRVRRSLFNVREVREQMLKANVLAQLHKEKL
jgi:hypothetical protein